MNDERVLPQNDKLQKLRSMMNRIQTSGFGKNASLSSYDLSDDRKENQCESTTPIAHSNDDSKITNAIEAPIISVLFRSVEPVLFDPNVDSLPNACFNCRKKGIHTYKECTVPKYYEFCLNCGRRGVEVHNCPRCYKAYQEFEKSKRPVEPLPPPKSIERSIERKKEKNRARSRVRNVELLESESYREKGRYREQSYEWPVDSRGFSSAERQSDKRVRERSNATNDLFVANYLNSERNNCEAQNPIRNSNDFQGTGLSTFEKKSRKGGNPELNCNAEGNILSNCEEEYESKVVVDTKLSSNDEPVKDFSNEFLKLMDVIKHLSIKTQTKVIDDFIEERQGKYN